MLRVLYLHDMDSYLAEWMECFKLLAQVRCELGCKDSKAAIKPSLASRNTLDMLRIIFNSAKNRHFSQLLLNEWYYSTGEEETVHTFLDWSIRLSTELFNDDGRFIPIHEENHFGMLDELFTCIELCEAITINVLHVGNSLKMVYMKRYAHIISFR